VNDVTAATARMARCLPHCTRLRVISPGVVMVIDTDSIDYLRVGETFVFLAGNVSKRRWQLSIVMYRLQIAAEYEGNMQISLSLSFFQTCGDLLDARAFNFHWSERRSHFLTNDPFVSLLHDSS